MSSSNLDANEFRVSTSDLREAFAQIPEHEFNAVWHALIDDLRDYANGLLHREGERRVTFTATKLAHNALFVLLVDENFRAYLASQNPPIPDWDAVARRELTADEQRSVVRALGKQMQFALRDRCRARSARKRGGGRKPKSLGGLLDAAVGGDHEMFALLNDELVRLEQQGCERQVEAFWLVHVAGQSAAVAAAALGVSEKTVTRDLAEVEQVLKGRFNA